MMKTDKELMKVLEESREAYREVCAKMQDGVKTLESIYGETVLGKPSETVQRFVEAVGLDTANEVVATLIHRHGWDGRIWRGAKEWASDYGWDEEAANRMWVYTNRIHMAHLNQIADEMRKLNG